MKTNVKRLALTAMLLTGASIASAEQNSQSVGDFPGYGETAYFHEDATYAEGAELTATDFVGDNHVGDSHVGDLPLEPALAGEYQAASHVLPEPIGDGLKTLAQPFDGQLPQALTSLRPLSGDRAKTSCETLSDSDCDGNGLPTNLMSRLIGRLEGSDYWASSEALLWFTPNRSMPALITTSDPATLPVLPEGGPNSVETVFGDDINGEPSGGIRLDFGKKMTENLSVGGRFWWLGNSDDSYFGSDDGSNMSIGRPYFNTDIGANDALLVAFQPTDLSGNDPHFSGSVAGRSQLKLWAAEGYAKLNLASIDNCKIDLIGGYTHFSINDMLSIESQTLDENTARLRRYSDYFENDNEFNGGQIGFQFALKRGRWSASSLTKIHLGNMNQRVQIAGSSSDQTFPAPATNASNGMLAMGNQGNYERDTFSFAPEANIKIGYAVRDNVNFTLGYSFIYFDNVSLVGDVIDTSLDPLFLNTSVSGSNPAFKFDDSSLWVQGIDFGLTIEI
ncbi:BBP7 family outer membrane beta-barrel protein [bacterium]|nr:BBP7 family outer membrane beta-barrel protein [bacterium]